MDNSDGRRLSVSLVDVTPGREAEFLTISTRFEALLTNGQLFEDVRVVQRERGLIAEALPGRGETSAPRRRRRRCR